uniref:hypothetical protein n=1 Tax=Algoriphagus sp. TaxID=1872435 RepID=UPI0040477A8E
CLFNYDFPDKVFFKRTGSGSNLYRSVVDGLWLGYLAIRAIQNRFWGSQADGNSGEIVVQFFIFSKRHSFLRYVGDGCPPHEPN